VKNYIREKLNSAAWLVRSIEQRRTTMLKVMYAIIERQTSFFEKGPPNLGPLKLQDIADMIGMHVSTVSRVTSNNMCKQCMVFSNLNIFSPNPWARTRRVEIYPQKRSKIDSGTR